MIRSTRRIVFLVGIVGSGALGIACSSSSDATSGDDTSSLDGGHGTDATIGDDGSTSFDGSTTDDGGAGIDASPLPRDASTVGDGGPGDDCTFNRDCIAVDRCECNEDTGCFCEAGVRGTGKNGIDPCTSGDDCASSLCVEGPDGGSFCSDECGSAADCTGALPMCTDVAFIGKICVRNP